MYQCPKCNHVGEYLVQGMGNSTNESCYKCGYDGQLERTFEGNIFSAHTNHANSRSKVREIVDDGLPNQIMVPIPKGALVPKAIVALSPESITVYVPHNKKNKS
jgi:hypothetical protein